MKKIFLSLIAAGSVFAAPFGLIIGESNYKQMLKAVPCKVSSEEDLPFAPGKVVDFADCKALEDLKSLELIFDENQILQLASFEYDGAQNFEHLGEQIAREVHYDFEPVPPVADRTSVFALPKYAITISNKKASSIVNVTYMSRKMIEVLKNANN